MRQEEIRIAITECLYNNDNGNFKGKILSYPLICSLLLNFKKIKYAYHSTKEVKEKKTWEKHDEEINQDKKIK